MVHLESNKDLIIADFKKGLSIIKLAKYNQCAATTMTAILVEWGVHKVKAKKLKNRDSFEDIANG